MRLNFIQVGSRGMTECPILPADTTLRSLVRIDFFKARKNCKMRVYKTMNRFALSAAVLASALYIHHSAMAQTIALDPGQRPEDERNGWLPYAFSTDTLGTTIGAAAFSTGKFRQPQSSLFGTAFASSNDSWGIVGAVNNIRLPGAQRRFLDSFLLVGHFADSRFYVDLDKNTSQAKAGKGQEARAPAEQLIERPAKHRIIFKEDARARIPA